MGAPGPDFGTWESTIHMRKIMLFQKLCFVSGHGFSRAEKGNKTSPGFSP
jgi:hypothetical protein